MSDTKQLRDALQARLFDIVTNDEELPPSMVSAVVNFLKAFPPPEDLDDLPAAKAISESLQKYAKSMPFETRN
jgi:hypothetical protein